VKVVWIVTPLSGSTFTLTSNYHHRPQLLTVHSHDWEGNFCRPLEFSNDHINTSYKIEEKFLAPKVIEPSTTSMTMTILTTELR
jgi:hypothetical protein